MYNLVPRIFSLALNADEGPEYEVYKSIVSCRGMTTSVYSSLQLCGSSIKQIIQGSTVHAINYVNLPS